MPPTSPRVPLPVCEPGQHPRLLLPVEPPLLRAGPHSAQRPPEDSAHHTLSSGAGRRSPGDSHAELCPTNRGGSRQDVAGWVGGDAAGSFPFCQIKNLS